MGTAERRAQREELEHLFHLIFADVQLNELKSDSAAQLEHCILLLIKLDNPPGKKLSPENMLSAEVNASETPAKYVALMLAPLIADAMVNFDTYAKGLKFAINKITAHRLNWVWSGGLDLAIMSMLPEGTGHTRYAGNVLSQFSIGTGYMSFVLYYFRLGLNLALLVHGTLKGSWMDPNRTQADIDMNIGIQERFRTQWQQRKFAIINDAFWATANMACFIYLIGNGMLGYIGGGLTAALLLMDIGLALWEYSDLETDHNELMEQYNNDIGELRLKRINCTSNKTKLSENIDKMQTEITLLSQKTTDPDSDQKKNALQESLNKMQVNLEEVKLNLTVLTFHVDGLIRDRKQCEFDWEYTNKDLYNNLIYALVLGLGFGFICCSILFPPLGIAAGNALILNLVGAAVSCVATMSIHAKTTSIQIEKSQALIAREIDVEYHTGKVEYNQRILSYKVASDVLIPAAVFACLVIAPTGIGLPILIPFIVTLFVLEYMVGQYKKPQESALPEIDSDENMGLGGPKLS